MARVKDIEIDEVPAELSPVYRRFTQYGPFLNQVRVFAHRPPALKHIMGMLLEMADEALVPKRYLEIAVVTVSKLNECAYCVAHHAPQLVDQGLGSDTVARILEDDCPGLDDIDRLVRDFAVQVTTQPQTMRDAIFDRLRAHFTEACTCICDRPSFAREHSPGCKRSKRIAAQRTMEGGDGIGWFGHRVSAAMGDPGKGRPSSSLCGSRRDQ